jgi:diguanylate cyclase (GGDEF)-like protein
VTLLGYPLLGRDIGRYVPLLRDPERLAALIAEGCPVDTEAHHESSRSFAGEVMVTRRLDGGRALSIARITDASSRRARERSLERLALHDALTELPNRLLLHDRLRQALRAAERSGEPLALMILDLDRFKEVNDTLGHHIGDLLLRELGPRLAAPLRRADTLARLGGDEFAVLLPAPTPRDVACQVAERLVEQLAKPFVVEGMRLEIGVSIGVALSPDHGVDLEAVLQSADSAMYKAKREAVGFVVFDEEEPSAYHRRLVLQRELRGAIEREELVLLLQPKLGAAGRGLVGVEVLVRWAHPELGLLEPKDFLAVAERTGLADQLALWTLNAALKEQRSWRLAGFDVPVSVDLTGGWLKDPSAPKILRLALDTWEVRAADLVVELAEGTVTSGLEAALPQLEAIAAMGCELSLDGFGTGFSPLLHLQRLPLSELRIDRSLVARTAEDPGNAVIVRSIVNLAHGLGLRVVGTGVDGAEAADWLTGLRCDHLQGYFLARPMDAAGLAGWLRSRTPSTAPVVS